MDILLKKRKRSENWSLSDKNLLRELCAQKISVIENKCVDTNTNRRKKDCWTQITNEFNSAADIQRDVVQAQFQWKGMKLKAKSAESAYRKAKNKTGGGPPPKSPSKQDQQLIDLIPNEFQIDFNEFDSDGAPLKNPELDKTYFEEEEILSGYYGEVLETNSHKENVDVNPSQLTVSPKKTPRKRRPVNDSELAYKKELFGLTKAHMIEEHELKIKSKKELFDLTKLHMSREHEAKMEAYLLERQCRQKELENIAIQRKIFEKMDV